MARTLPATPTRRVTRSSSRARPADDSSDDEEPRSTARSNARRQPTKSPVKKSAASAKKSPSKTASPAKKVASRRSSSASRKAPVEDSSDEGEVASTRRRSTSKRRSAGKKTPEKKSNPRSRSRTAKKDSDDEESDDKKRSKSPAGKKSPAKKSHSKKAASPVKKVIRTRSRSGTRKAPSDNEESDDEEEKAVAKKVAKKFASPVKKARKSVIVEDEDEEENEEEEDEEVEEPTAVMYRNKTPTVVVKAIDYVWLVLIGFIPLLASVINTIHVSPVIRAALVARCPKWAALNHLAEVSLFHILIANFILYLITAVLIAFKLRKSSTEAFVTTTITSMVFRLYVSFAILATWVCLFFVKRHIPEFILQIVSISLLASSLADLFYSFNSSSAARIFENVFSFALSYYVLFQVPAATNEAVKQLPAPLLSSLVLYAVVAALIAVGSVGVLSTSNTTHTSKTITAVSHACIWLHTIIAIAGPIVFFFMEVQQHLVQNFQKPAIIARAVAVTAAVLLNFTSYADAVSVNLNAKKD